MVLRSWLWCRLSAVCAARGHDCGLFSPPERRGAITARSSVQSSPITFVYPYKILTKLVFHLPNLLPVSQSYRWILTKSSPGIGAVPRKAIRKFNIVGVRKKKNSGQRRRKSGGGQTSRPRESNFHAPPSPRWGTDARSFAGTSECCCADETWRHRGAAGGRVELGSRSFWGGVL